MVPPPPAEGPIDIVAELEREIRAAKPSSVRVSALVALDRIRRQPMLILDRTQHADGPAPADLPAEPHVPAD